MSDQFPIIRQKFIPSFMGKLILHHSIISAGAISGIKYQIKTQSQTYYFSFTSHLVTFSVKTSQIVCFLNTVALFLRLISSESINDFSTLKKPCDIKKAYCIRKGARFWSPPLISALFYPCEQSIPLTSDNISDRTPDLFLILLR